MELFKKYQKINTHTLKYTQNINKQKQQPGLDNLLTVCGLFFY